MHALAKVENFCGCERFLTTISRRSQWLAPTVFQRMQWFFRYRVTLLMAVIGLTAFFGYSLRDFEVSFSFDSFRPNEAPELAFFEQYSDSFPTHENTILVAFAGPKGNIWDLDFLKKVDTTFERMRRIPNLDTVISPTRLLRYTRSGMGVSALPLIQLDSANALAASKERVAADPLLASVFFSADHQYVSGTLQVNPQILDDPRRDTLSHALRQVVEASGLQHVISGVPYIRTQYVETISSELSFFLGISILLAVLVMYWLFRSWWGVLLPILGVGIAMIWTFGFMAATGKPLDIIGELLPTVLFVAGISDIIHLVTRYQQDLQTGLEPQKAIRLSLKEIGGAVFLTSLTTAIGFASLYTSALPPIRSFGLYAAAGVMFAWITVIVLIPNVLFKLNPHKVRYSKGSSNNANWGKWLDKLHFWIQGHARWIFGVVAIICAVSIYGTTMISYDSYLLDDVSPKDPTRANMQFFEDHFYGARSFEMAIIPQKGKLVTDLDILQDLDTIQSFLQTQTRMSPFFSVVSYLKGAHQLYRGGNARFYKLPASDEKVEELLGMGYASGASQVISLTMTPERTMGRLGAKMGDIGSYKFEEIRVALADFVAKNCRTENFTYHLTGLAVINEANTDVLRNGLFSSLAMAIALIALIMGLLFRNWKMAIIGMIPNVIPLLVTAGMMGFCGITLRSSTSIVFLVAFGIAVDDTIHFMTRFRHELKAGRDLETGLMCSSFGGTFVIGLFTAVTLVVALLADMLLLPALIRLSGIGKQDPSSPTKSPQSVSTEPNLESQIT
jgi:uncharacterized protein